MNRKTIKKRARALLKAHYGLIVVIFIISSIIGVENASSVHGILTTMSNISKQQERTLEGYSRTILDRRFSGYGDILKYFSKGFSDDSVLNSAIDIQNKVQEGLQSGSQVITDALTDTPQNLTDNIKDGTSSIADRFSGITDDVLGITDNISESAKNVNEERKTEYLGPVEVSTRDGVIADIVNTLTSGLIFNRIFTGIVSIIGNESWAAIVFLVMLLLLAMFIWVFILRVFILITRRFILECRVYKTVPIRRWMYLIRAGKWFHSAWVLFATTAVTWLWMLTIVGGVIKYYQYRMVPYILSENPAVSATEAMKLSAEMMYRHKMECFKLDISFLGWRILGILTLGIVDVFYVNPYIGAAMGEYYTFLRENAKKRKLLYSDLLNDKYLYEKAGEEELREAYSDTVALMDSPMEQPPEQSGFAGFMSKYLGVVLFADKNEKERCKYEEQQLKIKSVRSVFEGRLYPFRLFPEYKRSLLSRFKKLPKLEYLHYTRRYSIWSIIIMFFIFCLVGWLWEVSLYLYEEGIFVNRGVLNGPWLPIYGSGGVLILMVLYRFRHNILREFFSIIILCGFLEYTTAWALDYLFNTKWWDYTGYFINIQGRICAEGLLVFAVGGTVVVYCLAPLIDNLVQKIQLKIIAPICIVLLLAFMGDVIYSNANPNTGHGITEYHWEWLEEPVEQAN